MYEQFGFSSDEVGAMTLREVSWRLEMAAEKMKRRGMRVGTAPAVDKNTEFTDKEAKRLDEALIDAQARIKERFKPAAF